MNFTSRSATKISHNAPIVRHGFINFKFLDSSERPSMHSPHLPKWAEGDEIDDEFKLEAYWS